MTDTPKPSNVHRRGFASMSKERHLEVSSKAGKSVPAEKRAFSTDPELQKRASDLGAQKTRLPK